MFPLSILLLHFLAGMQICHQLSSVAIHKTITYEENAGHFSSDIYTDLRGEHNGAEFVVVFFYSQKKTQCYYPLLTPPLDTHTHKRTHHLHNAAPDLSGPAKPIESLWRFICHGNVFLGTTPTRGEPGWSGQDKVVRSVSNSRHLEVCSCVTILLSISARVCLYI